MRFRFVADMAPAGMQENKNIRTLQELGGWGLGGTQSVFVCVWGHSLFSMIYVDSEFL